MLGLNQVERSRSNKGSRQSARLFLVSLMQPMRMLEPNDLFLVSLLQPMKMLEPGDLFFGQSNAANENA